MYQIGCSGKQLDDESVAVLNSLPKLHGLSISQPWSQQTFDQIANVSNLVSLHVVTYPDVGPETVTVERLRALKSSPRLERINIHSASFKDAALTELEGIQTLKLIVVTANSVTDQGIAALRQSRPDIQLQIHGKIYAATAEAPIDYAAERKAAEWVLKVGGSLSLVDAEGKPLTMQGQQLPQMPFAVTSVQLKNEFSDDDLKNLAACRRLDTLSLNSEKNFNGSGLRHLSSVGSLRDLQLNGGAMTDEGLSSLPVFTSLHTLHISLSGELTDDSLRHVGKLTKLQSLSLSMLPRVTNAGLAHLDELSELTGFGIEQTEGVTDEGLRRLFGHNPKLGIVRIDNRLKNEARTAQPLAVLPNVKGLGLSRDQLTDQGIATINSLPQFEVLSILGAISDEEARRAVQLKRLKQFVGVLEGADFSLSRVGVQALATIPELEAIHIHYNRAPDQFDDACLLDLAAAKKLKRITMGRPEALTDASIEAFRKARPDVFLQLGGKDYPATKSP